MHLDYVGAAPDGERVLTPRWGCGPGRGSVNTPQEPGQCCQESSAEGATRPVSAAPGRTARSCLPESSGCLICQ